MFARFLLGLRLVFGLPRRFLPTLSVRARIAALALIPVVGFIANGLNYLVSEQAIGQALMVSDAPMISPTPAAISGASWKRFASSPRKWPSIPGLLSSSPSVIISALR